MPTRTASFHTPSEKYGLNKLTALKELQKLHISSEKMTDATLKQLATLPRLRKLRLEAHVTHAGLKDLASCKELQFLDLTRTSVTDM